MGQHAGGQQSQHPAWHIHAATAMLTLHTPEQLSSLLHFPEAMRAPLLAAAPNLPANLEMCVMLVCMLAAIPLGYVHGFVLPKGAVRHVFASIVGLVFAYALVGGNVAHSLASCVGVYVGVSVLPSAYSPLFAWVFSMAYLSYGHIVRMQSDDKFWSLEFTMFQMVMVAKQIMFAYNVADGKALKRLESGKLLDALQWKHEFRVQRALTAMPNPLEYMSYMFFFGGLIVGPPFEMKEYLDYTNETGEFAQYRNHSPLVAVLKSLLWVAFSFAGFEASKHFSVEYILDARPESAYLAGALLGSKLLYRIVYQFVAVTFSRFKYYFVWNLAESACIASGLGFNKIDAKTGTASWDRVNNIDYVQVELGESLPELTNGWNRRIDHWLKHYIYYRVSSNKTIANLCTKLTSAFWHGFYPGYYMLFGFAFFVGYADDAYRALVRPLFYRDVETVNEATGKTEKKAIARVPAPLRWVYHAGGMLQMHFMLNYFALAFLLLDIRKGLYAWGTISYAGHVVTFGMAAVGVALSMLSPKPRAKKMDAKASVAATPSSSATPSVAAQSESPAIAAVPASNDAARVTSPQRRSKRAD